MTSKAQHNKPSWITRANHSEILWRGRWWRLRATPQRKYPWLLECAEKPERQEIGVHDPVRARKMAETWLELRDLLPAPAKDRNADTTRRRCL
ncbi:hypothetical protein [Amycolatopsis albispora]|uniref:hypothetical protein n=1 Tax=Amycolatopsis albispora TaxID=1804986 RepID=UPI001F1BB921|nr:hypothetical protein [Amycolatopsis albispora]